MSRIGKIPIAIPKGVTATVKDGAIILKGPKGELRQDVKSEFKLTLKDDSISVARPNDAKESKSLHGLYRALINNMMKGVSVGYVQGLEIEGVGYTAKAESPRKLVLNIGFNAPVVMIPPEGMTVETPKNTIITIKGPDKQKVGQFAAEVRGIRPPEPYKGKGIKYEGEHIIRKVGKAIGGKSAG